MEPPISPTESPNEPAHPELSEREIEVLRLVATGASNKEIAQELAISPNTVKVHLRNIFAKIGVQSRTEATLYAIQHAHAASGLRAEEVAEAGNPDAGGVTEAVPAAAPISTPSPLRQWWMVGAVVLGLVVVTAIVVRLWPVPLSPYPTPAAPTAPATPTAVPRWETKAPLPTARSKFGVVTYEGQIYVVAGESTDGVTGRTDRYDPQANAWKTLSPKPIAVAEVGAAVVGGRIYVPGGRLASGVITSTTEVYDPQADKWEQCAPLPGPVSAYALVAFEGKLYVFGGDNGEKYTSDVYVYNPDLDKWTSQPSMPTPRAYAGAAVAAGKIYVIGGTDGKKALDSNETFVPERVNEVGGPWEAHSPLPNGRYGFGAVTVADMIYLVGGKSNVETTAPFEYFPEMEQWQEIKDNNSSYSDDVGLGLAAIGTNVHVLGGERRHMIIAEHESYQSVYVLLVPLLPAVKPTWYP